MKNVLQRLPVSLRALCLLLLMTAAANTAAKTDTVSVQDIKNKLTLSDFIEGSFSQERELAGFTHTLKSKGKFFFWKEQGFFWEVAAPFYRATTFRKDKTINWSDTDTIAHEAKPSIVQKQINKILVALLSGNFQALDQHFDLNTSASNEETWLATLTPKNKTIKKQVRKIAISGSVYIEKIEIETSTEDATRIFFTKPNTSQNPTPAQCIKFYPNTSDSPCENTF